MRHLRLELKGTAAWFAGSLLLAALATGCHGDTNQGGGTDQGHAAPGGSPQVQQGQQHVPTPPTADQMDPSSPRAVLSGTSTTQTTTAPSPPAQSKDGRPVK